MASLKITNITVGEQIPAEKLIEKRIVMMISKAMIDTSILHHAFISIFIALLRFR